MTDERLRREDYYVKTVPAFVCRRMVEQYHYSRRCGANPVFRHGLFHVSDDMSCLGVACWMCPMQPAAESAFDGEWRQVLGLTRLAIRPDVPKNAASFLISQSIRLIRQDGRFCCLITYADTWQGHTGAIYRATNWEYLGVVPGEPTYIDSAGRMGANKSDTHHRSSEEMKRLGYENLGTFPKHKFRMILKPPRTAAPRGQIPLRFFEDTA